MNQTNKTSENARLRKALEKAYHAMRTAGWTGYADEARAALAPQEGEAPIEPPAVPEGTPEVEKLKSYFIRNNVPARTCVPALVELAEDLELSRNAALKERDAALNETDHYKLVWEKVSGEYQGTLKEIRALTDQIDLNRDEFLRIIAALSQGGFNDHIRTEAIGICKRSQQRIVQNVPMIEQRNKFEKERNEAWRALNQIEAHFGFGDGSQCSAQEIADKLTKHP